MADLISEEYEYARRADQLRFARQLKANERRKAFHRSDCQPDGDDHGRENAVRTMEDFTGGESCCSDG